MLKKERFTAKQSTTMGQIPRSIERISSIWYTHDRKDEIKSGLKSWVISLI